MANILIVDDERSIRRILSVLLTERRHRVTEVGSGEEAVRWLASPTEPRPDLVLLDLKLPGMDGLETLEKLRALSPRLDVVMMTAHALSARRSRRCGAARSTTSPNRSTTTSFC